MRRGTAGGGSSLADVLDRVLDKGIVIDAWVRVSIVGLELLTVEARVVIASVETYLKYAEAIRKIELASKPESESKPMSYTRTPYLEEGPKKLAADLPEKIADAIGGNPRKIEKAVEALPKKLSGGGKKLVEAVKGVFESDEEPEEATIEPSEEEVADYLADHKKGLALDDLEEHFHTSRKQLQSVLEHLVEARRARWDEARDVIVPRGR